MDSQILKLKLSAYNLTNEPFIELDRCFAPCVSNLKLNTINDSEKACYSNCISKYVMATHDLKLSLLMLSRSLQTVNSMREVVEKELKAADSK